MNNERLLRIIRMPVTLNVGIGVISFAAGAVGGYIFANRRPMPVEEFPQQLGMNFDVVINAETGPVLAELKKRTETLELNKDSINAQKEEYAAVIPTEKISKGEEFVKSFKAVTADDEGNVVVHEAPKEDDIGEEVTPPVLTKNVFGQNEDDDWDYEAEMKGRSTVEPYILHKDEFYDEELGYSQTTLTYYAGDNIMVDEDESPIYNFATVVGELKFGHGSGDSNVFYVRNDKRRAEYEIIHDDGLYSVEVLGLDIENNERARDLKHSKLSKFQMD